MRTKGETAELPADGYTRRGDPDIDEFVPPTPRQPGLVRFRQPLMSVAVLMLLAILGGSRPASLVLAIPVVVMAIYLAGEWQRRRPAFIARRARPIEPRGLSVRSRQSKAA